MKRLFLSIIVCLLLSTQQGSAQAPAFARGADVSWFTEMEADGKKFYDANGTETEFMALMRKIGMNAVRLRVWVNPSSAYGAWSDKADVLVKARRAKAQGLAVMIDFHYSDFFADPGTQTKPADWASLSFEQLKQAVATHTRDVLDALKTEGIEPVWVQVGNETRNGMIWDSGKLWNGTSDNGWGNYVALSNAGYAAVKDVFPNALVIVHIDKGQDDNVWFYKSFKQYGGKFDMIGLSYYPSTSGWSSQNQTVANNVKTLKTTFSVPVMIVEVGYPYTASDGEAMMTDLFDKVKALSSCSGIFYWEPEVYNWWKPAYYTKLGWNAYGNGAFTPNGRPAAVLNPFYDPTDNVPSVTVDDGDYQFYNVVGQPATADQHGIVIAKRGNDVRKVVNR